jgi:hypothetical protein
VECSLTTPLIALPKMAPCVRMLEFLAAALGASAAAVLQGKRIRHNL